MGVVNENRKASQGSNLRTADSSGANTRTAVVETETLATNSPAASIDGLYIGWRTWAVKNGGLVSDWDGSSWAPGIARRAQRYFDRTADIGPVVVLVTTSAIVLIGLIMAPWSFAGIPNALLGLFSLWFFYGLVDVNSHNCKHVEDPPHSHHKAPPCGLYASVSYLKWVKPAPIIRRGLARFSLRTYVGGEVSLWGKVIEHENGAVGQYAYPIRFTHVSCIHCGMPTDLNEATDYLGYVSCTGCNFPRTTTNKPRMLKMFTPLAQIQAMAQKYGLPN